MDEFKINLDALNTQPSLHSVLKFYKHRGLVGEEAVCLLQTLLAIKKQPFGISALSGGGKSATVDILANHNKYGDEILLPKAAVFILQLSSKTAHMYNAREINKASIIYIEELQKAGNSLEMGEFLKNLAEGKDVTRSVRDQANRQNLQQKINKGKGIIYTLALENSLKTDAEMNRRFIVLTTNVSKQQTEKVIKRKAKERFARTRLNLLDEKEIDIIKSHIAECIYEKTNIIYENPFSEFIAAMMPIPDQKIRSFCDHFFNLIEASALFHKKSRTSFMTGKTRLTKHYIINIEDVAIIHQLYSTQFMRDVHSIPVMGLDVLKAFDVIDYDKTIYKQKGEHRNGNGNKSAGLTTFLNKSEDADNEIEILKWAAIVDIRDTLKTKLNIILSHKICKETCDDLYNAGYLLKNMNGNTPEYAIADKIIDFSNSINWEECYQAGLNNMKKYYPEHLDEWIMSQTIDKQIGYINPLTNENIYLQDLIPPIMIKLNAHEISFLIGMKKITPCSQKSAHEYINSVPNGLDIFNSLYKKDFITNDNDGKYTISEKANECIGNINNEI